MICPLITLLIVALSAQLVQSDTCGRRATLGLSLISNGINSTLGQWPWHSAVYHRVGSVFATYQCGGTIISRNFIVTAAHCTYPASKTRPLTIREIEVVVGITDRKEREASSIQMSVAKIERHEDYNLSTTGYDIALLKLANELDFTDYVKPICLWMGSDGDEDIEGKDGYVPGWGKDENSELPDKLKHVKMLIVSRKSCQASDDDYYSRHLFDRMAFCAGYRDGTSVNSGDSGGGLYIEMEGEWQLRGIVSNGKLNSTTQNLDTSSFIVFTDVAYFRSWIQSKMGVRKPIVQDSEDYAVCGKKKELKFQRRGFKEERKWPWQGEVYRNATRLCEVVIVSDFFLVSPADVYSRKDIRLPQNMNALFRNVTGHVLANYRVERILRHEDFSRKPNMHNIALLQLESKIMFSRLLRSICIPNDVIYDRSYTCMIKFGEGRCCFGQCFSTMPSEIYYHEYNGTYYLRGMISNVSKFKGEYVIEILDIYQYKDWIQNQQHQEHHLGSIPLNLLAQDCTLDKYAPYDRFQVLVSGNFQCYSTLIAPTLLITTGSCVNDLPAKSIRVQRDYEERLVREIHLHPHFDIQRYFNNIAIIEIGAPFEEIYPLCLPTSSEDISKLQTQINFLYAEPLSLTIMNVKTCAYKWRSEEIQLATDGSYICANLKADLIERMKTNNSLLCELPMQGLAMIYKVNDTYFTRGILDITLNNRCYHYDLSEVFVDVLFYADWIREIYSNCSSCHEDDEEPIEEWRNMDPVKQFQHNQANGTYITMEYKIVNCGNPSEVDEWPWHSAVFHRVGNISRYACGGTILSSRYIVTAAHCTWTESKSRPLMVSEMEVVVGTNNILNWQPSARQMSLARIDRHEDYNISTSDNDIALLQLADELEFTDYVKPICRWSGHEDHEALLRQSEFGNIPGWSKDKFVNIPGWGGLPDLLYNVRMPIFPQEYCWERFDISYPDDGRTFCAGFGNGSTLTLGYGGSGLHIKNGDNFELRGIVSIINTNCGRTVVTDVVYFRPWILSKISDNWINEMRNGKTRSDKAMMYGEDEEL